MIEVAIVGGGPGGLMAAWHLRQKLGERGRLTLFEASGRLGGKVQTGTFAKVPVGFDAGVAEFYDYSKIGPDPLRELVESLGLRTRPMGGDQVQLDGELHAGLQGIRDRYGDGCADAILDFRAKCRDAMSAAEYYEGAGASDNAHPWAHKSCEELLEEQVADPDARRFLRVMARSDIATESYATSGLNGLKNFLMDIDGYLGVYAIEGGNETLIDGLRTRVDADIRLRQRLLQAGRAEDGRYELHMLGPEGAWTARFDRVLLCLSHSWLMTIDWQGEVLRRAMVEHLAYFNTPGHYLRVVLLFDSPTWEGCVAGDWFMSEAFGGSCVYATSALHGAQRYGILNWLIPGADALAYLNLTDAELGELALAALPVELGDVRSHWLEVQVHRWAASVNALPGGASVRDLVTNHRPEPKEHPGLLLVGDYMFDSTLNGLLDSADAATDLLVAELAAAGHLNGASDNAC